ncbi:MAG: hypothetical protein EKK55_02320 [Rhodocyclaceae bacterium]|nr:MAG: hypothetical protein EKK55_02320 [Rhodocyclaceae bacterium]
MITRISWCARCGEEACDGCELEGEHDAAQGPDALDPLEAVRDAHRAELALLLRRVGRSDEEISRAIERTRKKAA